MDVADVIVVGAGRVGLEAARSALQQGVSVTVLEKRPGAGPPPPPPIGFDPRMAVDLILSPDEEVAGVLVADEKAWEVVPLRAKAVVLATGGIEALYPLPRDPLATGDGLVIAHRAGAPLRDVRVAFPEGRARIVGGVASDARGAVGEIPGLYVAGEASASRSPGETAGALAARELRDEPPAFGPYGVMPNVDSRLPAGFADAKFNRLRSLMARHLGAGGPSDLASGRAHLHRLKGEADEYARARIDPVLLSLRNACEVALLLFANAEA